MATTKRTQNRRPARSPVRKKAAKSSKSKKAAQGHRSGRSSRPTKAPLKRNSSSPKPERPSQAIVPQRDMALVSLGYLGHEFVYAPGEPYAAEPNLDRPVSLWSGIQSMRLHHPDEWAAMGRDLFNLYRKRSQQLIMTEGVLWMALETNRVEVGTPFLVWLDPDGKHFVRVYRDWDPRRGDRTGQPVKARKRKVKRSKRS